MYKIYTYNLKLIFAVCMLLVSRLTTLLWTLNIGAHPWEWLIYITGLALSQGVSIQTWKEENLRGTCP